MNERKVFAGKEILQPKALISGEMFGLLINRVINNR
jgi:hypothetical protein